MKKKEHLILAAIFLAGLAVRILFFRHEVFIGNNPAFFARLGKNLVENGMYAFGENYNMGLFFPPGYPTFVGLMNLLVNDLFLSGKLVSLVASLITIIIFYMIGKEIYNKEAGLFAAFAFAALPLALKMSVVGQTDALFYCFAFLSIYLFIVSARKDNLLIYIPAGILTGMAYLTRPEGLLLLLLPFLCSDSLNPFRNKRQLLKITIVFSLFILVISPYLLFVQKSTGKFSLSGKSSTAAFIAEMSESYHELMNIEGNPDYDSALYSLNAEKNQVRLFDENSQVSFVGFVAKHPASFLKKYGKNIIEEQKIFIKLLAPIMLPLFFAFFTRDLLRAKSRLIFILFPLMFFLINPAVLIMERHALLSVLFLIIFSSVGFANSGSALSIILDFYEIGKNRLASLAVKNIKYIIITVFIMSTVPYLMFSNAVKTAFPVEAVNAGRYLKNNISAEYEKLNVMSRQPWVSFYSDARFTWLPYADIADLVHFAKLYKVDYIVIDERLLGKWKFYDRLTQMDKYSDDVTLAYEDRSGRLIKLFRVNYKKG
ncbi:MAG: glycosyltransferase family 39 protein [Deferribacteres bacterium]|nr:glycosyltransferase family 39 protein [Deferribacteres bacterium]